MLRRIERKIFGIGLSKTGTTSLATAMELLGFTAKHGPSDIKEVDKFDFLNDISISWRFRTLDMIFPNAKFILTVRDKKSWLKSCKRHFAHRKPSLRWLEHRIMCYQQPEYDEERFGLAYDRHSTDVMQHFGDREAKLLVMDICAGDGWDKLCPFLQRAVPNRKFPWCNAS